MRLASSDNWTIEAKKEMKVNSIYCGDALSTLKTFPDNVIDCIITSPPYFKLRDYGCEGQLGQENTTEEFVNRLCDVFSEVRRVLKKTGTCFVNLGDSYVDGSLQMIPERFAFEMIKSGWILRNEIIWHRPNQMPSSADNRFTVDFEKIFFFVKNSDYYFEQQLEAYTKPLERWGGDKLEANGKSTWDEGTGQTTYRNRDVRPNPDGRNMRTVWSINTEPSEEKHFASYPEALVTRLVNAGCPKDGVVLDPFFGIGTTGIVSKKLGRNYIGIELNPEYVEISKHRFYKEFGLFL